jgi:lipid A 3-O-deacylase
MLLRNTLRLATIALLIALPGTSAAGDAPRAYSYGGLDVVTHSQHYLDVGIGVFDVYKSNSASRRSAAGHVELRLGERIYAVGPAFGIVANTDGGAFGYGAVYADLKYRNLVFTPLAGLGAYHEGASSDLGGIFQFRLAFGISYQLADDSRVGLTFAHISNAHIHDLNPGENELNLCYALPI